MRVWYLAFFSLTQATLEVKSAAEPKQQQQQGVSPNVRELPTRNASPGRTTGLPSTSPKPEDPNLLRHDGERQNIPFPRLCSAVFGVNGMLLKIVNVPKDATPLTKNKMVRLD